MKTTLQILLFTVLLGVSFSLMAQSPGGVGTTNLTAWWNPDNLPLGNATTWTTLYPTGASAIVLTDGSAPYATVTNTPSGNHSNYNKTLDFTGNLANSTGAMALERTGTLNLINNNLSTSQGTFFAVYFMNDATSNQHIVDYRETSGDAIQFRKLANMRYAITTSNSLNAARDFPDDGKPMIMCSQGNKSTSTSLKTRLRCLDIAGTPVNSSASTGGQLGLTVGMRKANATSFNGAFQSYLSELIFFNTNLGLIDLLKVESYLAVKYGITLDPSSATAGGYLTSAGGASWDPTTILFFHNDVIGIGRDDASALLQKQSHSFDDAQRIYLSTLVSSTLLNTGTFTNDISYVMMGHNNAVLNETALATAEMPSGQNLMNRIAREYRVTNTNFVNTFSIDITLNNFTNFTTNPSELCLLVDNDDDFTNATVLRAGLTFSINGNVVTVAGISNVHIPADSTRFITLASITTPAPVSLLSFDATLQKKNVVLRWASATELDFEAYSLQHSLDGKTWRDLTTIAGKGDHSEYEYLHTTPMVGENFYRLKMLDIDNQEAISDTRMIYFHTEEVLKAYPNPVTSILWLEGNQAALRSIRIINQLGQDLKLPVVITADDKAFVDFSKLPKGVYWIKSTDTELKVVH